MKYPALDEYQAAVQSPQVVFFDLELKSASAKTNSNRMPLPYSGGFVISFCMQNASGKAWCVRCFKRENPDRQKRYEAISQFILTHSKKYLVKSAYQSKGISLNNQAYPIIKMDWVAGKPLNRFIEDNLNDKPLLDNLAEQLRATAADLQVLGVAHGDLQHGNILVKDKQLILVDYDGMYVPALAGLASDERGHVDYQHPLRNQEFNANLDRFASVVLYLALRAVTPDLWQKYSNGDNILFRQDDFRQPDQSALLKAIEKQPQNRTLVHNFRAICKLPLHQLPTLEEFLASRLPDVASSSLILPKRHSQYSVIAALDHAKVATYHGDVVTAVGQITEVSEKKTRYGDPMVFINFEDWRRKSFRIVAWSECLRQFKMNGIELPTYCGKWVSVTGLLQKYEDDFGVVPQIELDAPASLNRLANENEAKALLVEGTATRSVIEMAQQSNGASQAPQLSDTVVQTFAAQQPSPYPSAHSKAKPTNSSSSVDISDWHKNQKPEKAKSQSKTPVSPPSVMLPASTKANPIWIKNGKLAEEVGPKLNATTPVQSNTPINSATAPTQKLPTLPSTPKKTLLDRISAIFARWLKS